MNAYPLWVRSLAKSDVVHQLVDYVIVDPPADAGDELRYKYVAFASGSIR